MKKQDFNHGWTVRPISRDGSEEDVTLPHDAMLSEPRGIESPGGENIGWYLGGDYEYRKSFVLAPEMMGKRLTLELEGVYQRAEVFINDRKAAFCPYGYTGFFVEAGPFLREGKNEIRVTARNSDQPNSRWYTGTGIYRPVWLYTSDREHYIPVNGIRVRTESAGEGKIAVAVKTVGRGPVELEIMYGEECVARATAVSNGRRALFHITIEGAKLWSTDEPNLYRVRALFGGDSAEETFGIRRLDWSPEKGLTINGRREILRGACIHHDNGIIGAVTFPEAEDRRVRLLKESGYNAIRSSHNPCSKYLLDACDRYGMLVMDEYIDHWYIHKTKYDYVDYMEEWWKRDLSAMVEKDYNHPSVIMYSTGNEVAETGEKRGIAWQRAMTRFLHRLDPSRPVTCGINIFFNFLYSIGMGVYSDEKAAGDSGSAGAKAGEGSPSDPTGSAFYNMLAVKLGDRFMKFGATLPPCDFKTRGAFAVMDIAGYNYGIWRYRHDIKKYPGRLILGTETFCKDAWLFWEIAEKEPRVVGDFVWSGMDYIGETGAGAAGYQMESIGDDRETCMTGGNGRIDLTGKPNAESKYTLVALGQERGPYIAVKPPCEKVKPPITGWQLTRGLMSWSFEGCEEGRKTEVEVFARAASVEIFVNNVSYGRKRMPRTCRAAFTVPYKNGSVTAVARDVGGREIGRSSLVTASGETVLRADRETESISPEGVGYVRIRYTDQAGTVKVLERHTVSAVVEGGRLLGLGNANPWFRGNYTDGKSPTYFGEALAVVRADPGSGQVRVTVTDENNEKASALFKVREQVR